MFIINNYKSMTRFFIKFHEVREIINWNKEFYEENLVKIKMEHDLKKWNKFGIVWKSIRNKN